MVSIDTNSSVKTKLSLNEGEEVDSNNPLSQVFASILATINESNDTKIDIKDNKNNSSLLLNLDHEFASDVGNDVTLNEEQKNKINIVNIYLVSNQKEIEVNKLENNLDSKYYIGNNKEGIIGNNKEGIKNNADPHIRVSLGDNYPIKTTLEKNSLIAATRLDSNIERKLEHRFLPDNKISKKNEQTQNEQTQNEQPQNETNKLLNTVKKAIQLLKKDSKFKNNNSDLIDGTEDNNQSNLLHNKRSDIFSKIVNKISYKGKKIEKNYLNENFKGNTITNQVIHDNYNKKNDIKYFQLDNFDNFNFKDTKSYEIKSGVQKIGSINSAGIANINQVFSGNQSSSNIFGSESLNNFTEVLDFTKDSWNEKLTNSIKDAIRKGSNRIDFSIEPKRLGRLTITLVIDGGSADIVINASNSNAAQIIGESQMQLQKMLSESGMHLENFQTNGNGGSNNNSNGKYDESNKNNNQSSDLVEESIKDIDNNNNNDQILNLNA